jgi:ATP-dependent exoDNAse (exonuclease V) beta subunit
VEAARKGDDSCSDGPAGGAAFGALVHAILAQSSFDATREALDGIARIEARVLGLRDGEAAAAALKVERVFRHALLARARAAATRGACRRETAVTCQLPDGMIVEGIVDLAFEEHGTWIVVDYKTDREFVAGGEERYRRQVALYAAAIAQATGAAATGVLLRV